MASRAGRAGSPKKPPTYVLVVGDEASLKSDEGAANELTRLGANVRTSELFAPYGEIADGDGDDTEPAECRVVVVESGDRPDIAALVIRSIRKEEALAETPILVAVPERQVARLDPGAGFDDFIVAPYFPAELYARVRMLEWRNSEFSSEELVKLGDLVVDVAAHEVRASGRAVTLTSREFALLVFLMNGRGRVFSREALLARVWGTRYDGGARTVDIHVRRLRAKLGDALPLETVRGAGYKVRMPSDAPAGEAESDEEPIPLARARASPGSRRTGQVGAGQVGERRR